MPTGNMHTQRRLSERRSRPRLNLDLESHSDESQASMAPPSVVIERVRGGGAANSVTSFSYFLACLVGCVGLGAAIACAEGAIGSAIIYASRRRHAMWHTDLVTRTVETGAIGGAILAIPAGIYLGGRAAGGAYRWIWDHKQLSRTAVYAVVAAYALIFGTAVIPLGHAIHHPDPRLLSSDDAILFNFVGFAMLVGLACIVAVPIML